MRVLGQRMVGRAWLATGAGIAAFSLGLVVVPSALAAPTASGTLTRDSTDSTGKSLVLKVTNTSSSDSITTLDFTIGGSTSYTITMVSPSDCTPHGSGPAGVFCSFSTPLAPGGMVTITFHTEPMVPDNNAGNTLQVCNGNTTSDCNSSSVSGPAPASSGGGTGTTGTTGATGPTGPSGNAAPPFTPFSNNVSVIAEPRLHILKSSLEKTAKQGDLVTYAIYVYNDGTAPATNVHVGDIHGYVQGNKFTGLKTTLPTTAHR